MFRKELLETLSSANPLSEKEWILYYEKVNRVLRDIKTKFLEDDNVPVITDEVVLDKVRVLATSRKFQEKIEEDTITFKKENTEFSFSTNGISEDELTEALNKLGI